MTGLIHPDRVKPNSGARAGDALVLTKALGTGVISTALKRGIAAPEHVEASIQSMLTLNRLNGEEHFHGCTDVTGFGLIGHAREMILGSSVSFRLRAESISLLPGAADCVRAGFVPGGLKNNRDFAECIVIYEWAISDELKALLFDPQTAGGLLISVAAEDGKKLLQELQNAEVPAYQIGNVIESQTPRISIY